MRHYGWIDPLRGFAAVSVLLYHLGELAALPLPTSYPGAWFRIGFLGVDLFFAISGAVIMLSLAALQRQHGGQWRAPFGRRRLARIVPLYLLTSLLFVLLVQPEILQRPDVGWLLAAQLSFTHNLFANTHGVINGPSWTLAVEMQFYLLMLLAGGVALRLPLRWLALIGITVMVAWRLAVMLRTGADPAAAFRGATQLPGVLDTFIAGIIAARWQLRRESSGRGSVHGRRMLLAAAAAWVLGIGLMHVAAGSAGGYWGHPIGLVGSHLLVSIAAGLSVAAALALPAARRAIPGLRASGDLSYGIYLWHLPVILLVAGLLASPWTNALLVIGATLLLSVLGWRLVERPAMALVRDGGSSPATSVVAGGAAGPVPVDAGRSAPAAGQQPDR